MVFSLFKKKDKPKSIVVETRIEESNLFPDPYAPRPCIPSPRGLTVGEILLLDYVKQGKLPSKNGYARFWNKYAVSDVDKTLADLNRRGFIEQSPVFDSLNSEKSEDLKKILSKYGLPSDGKKSVLIERIRESVPEDDLLADGFSRGYRLTGLGAEELDDNGYVPYMHKCEFAKSDDFNVWYINKKLNGNPSDWRRVVYTEHLKIINDLIRINKDLVKDSDPRNRPSWEYTPDEMKQELIDKYESNKANLEATSKKNVEALSKQADELKAKIKELDQ